MQRQTKNPTLLPCFTRIVGAGAMLIAGASVTPADARPADDGDLPRAEQLLDKHVEATGGKRARLELKTRKKTGKLAVDMAGHKFEARTEEQFLAPDKSHVVIDGDFFHQVNVCDGEHAWEWRPGPSHGDEDHASASGVTELLEGSKLTRALAKARFHAAADWRERYKSVKTLAVVAIDERPAYEVRVVPKLGDPYSNFYDQETGRLVKKVESVESGHMGVLDMQVFFEDYREFDGVWIATRIHAQLSSPTMGKGTQTWTYTKVVHNQKIPASLFEMPEELKARVHEEAARKKHGEKGGDRSGG